MNILLLAEYYPPMTGGVATSAHRIAHNLAKLGVDVFVVCFDERVPLESNDTICISKEDKVTVFRVGPFFIRNKSNSGQISDKFKALLRLRMLRQIVNLSSDVRPDLIVSFFVKNMALIGNLVSHELNLPHVICFRGGELMDNLLGNNDQIDLDLIIRSARGIVCVNEHNRQLLRNFSHTAYQKADVIHNSPASSPLQTYTNSRREEIRRQLNWDDKDLVLTFIGDLRVRKGVDLMFRGMKRLASNPAIRFLVIGPSFEEPYIAATYGACAEKLLAQNKLYITGRINQSNVYEWAIAGDVIWMPSLDDGISNGLIEGMACGLCPVVSKVFSDLIRNGENGIVVDYNEGSLIKAIELLYKDRLYLKTLGLAAKSTVSQRTPKIEASEFLEVFVKLST